MEGADHTFHRRYSAEPEAVPAARRALAAFATEIGASPDKVTAIRLAMSEAVTNAVLHGYRGARGEIDVTAELAGDELAIVVGDEGCGMHSPSESTGLGLGLALISELADRLAIARRRDGGVELRMSFALVAPGTAPAVVGSAQVAAA